MENLNDLEKDIEDINIDRIEIDDIYFKLKDLYYKNKEEAIITTGDSYIDKCTGGFKKGTLNTILGYTGNGKTTYACNIAYHAVENKQNVLYISLEIPKSHIFYNFLSRFSFSEDPRSIPHEEMKSGKLQEVDATYLWDVIYPKFTQEFKNNLYVIDETDITAYDEDNFSKILKQVNNYIVEKTGKGIEILIIDHIQLMKFEKNNKRENDIHNIINKWVSYFRKQSMNFLDIKEQIAIILVAQANREGWKYARTHNGKYLLTALAEANELERASAIVIAVYTDDNLKNSKEAKMQAIKCRDGRTMEESSETFADFEYYVFGDMVKSQFGGVFEKNMTMEDLLEDKKDSTLEELIEEQKKNETIDINEL